MHLPLDALADGCAVGFAHRLLAEELALDDQTQRPYPALDPQEVAIGGHGRVGHHLVRGCGFLDAVQKFLAQLDQGCDQLEIKVAFRPEALDEKAAAVVVDLGVPEGLLPVGFAVGAAAALDDVEMTACLATKLEELGPQFFLDLPLMSLGGGVNQAQFIGE